MLGAKTDTLLCKAICAAWLEGAEIRTVSVAKVLEFAASMTWTVAVPPAVDAKVAETVPPVTALVTKELAPPSHVPSDDVKVTFDWVGALTVTVSVWPISRVAGLLGLEMTNAAPACVMTKSSVAVAPKPVAVTVTVPGLVAVSVAVT